MWARCRLSAMISHNQSDEILLHIVFGDSVMLLSLESNLSSDEWALENMFISNSTRHSATRSFTHTKWSQSSVKMYARLFSLLYVVFHPTIHTLNDATDQAKTKEDFTSTTQHRYIFLVTHTTPSLPKSHIRHLQGSENSNTSSEQASRTNNKLASSVSNQDRRRGSRSGSSSVGGWERRWQDGDTWSGRSSVGGECFGGVCDAGRGSGCGRCVGGGS